MSAAIYKTSDLHPDGKAISECARVLRAGGIAVFPTETVYGIGVDAFNAEAIARLYAAKHRSAEKPLLMHISGLAAAEELAYLDPHSRELIARFTPGPLTLILKRRSCIPANAVSGGDTVGLRFPSNGIFLALAKEFGGAIAATSANISGAASAVDASGVSGVSESCDIILDGGHTEYGLESTIISLVGEKPRLLRRGSFDVRLAEEVVGRCE